MKKQIFYMTFIALLSGCNCYKGNILQIEEQGSFAVGGTVLTDSLGHKYHGDHAYVFYQKPVDARMVLDNSNSPYHIEEELWLQILSLSRELQECKASLHHNTLDCISDKIEGIERELDVLLDILQGRQDKKTS